MKIIRDFIVRFGIFTVLFLFSVLAVSFGFPWVFEQIESITSSPLPFEGALRIFILGIHALLLLLTGAWVFIRGDRTHRMIWVAFLFSLFILGFIFFGDKTHRLLEEFSWIRYSTSAFLILASLCGLAIFVKTFKKRGFFEAAFWLVLGGGFMYGGLDEVLEIHEAIGTYIQKMFSFTSEVTDYVTVGYALVALVVVFSLVRARMSEFITHYRISAYVFLSGACVYAFSTLLDTFDVFVHAKLRAFANVFTTDGTFVISDAWYLLWSIKNSLNGFEEVFEHTAALLFLIALAIVLFERAFKRGRPYSVSQWKQRTSIGILIAVVLGIVTLSVLSLPFTFPSSVIVTKGVQVKQIASYSDGLFHTDDLAFHPSQGVIIANEGRGSVYRFRDGQFTKISDPKNSIHDPDSVAASERGVFISDGNAGNIIRFDTQGGEIIATRSNGFVHPEGIAVAGGTVYILDESQKTLSRYSQGKKIEHWKPAHPEWQTPEGISYDQSTDTVYVTDDTTGAIFRAKFGKTLEKIAELPAPEDIEVLRDGSMLVTDTAWGAIFQIFPNGQKTKLIQFGRMYRDTEGITIDEKGSLYVVTADGFASTSFMPSFLFRIDGIHL
ncbi:MAG: hypothetical protein Q7R79_02920 [bacterium]|nr:hypothetical protein [bacterium]